MYEVEVAGYHCYANITYVSGEHGSGSYDAASDFEYKGWCDVEFELRWHKDDSVRATWLEKRMTKEEKVYITDLLERAMRKSKREDDEDAKIPY